MTKTNADRIREFHGAINGGELPERPVVPSVELLALRWKLIDEEYGEVVEAFEELKGDLKSGSEGDLTELIHELTDLLYVTYGAILTCGVDADGVFDEVHRANMRKVSGPVRADGKQLKPEGWQPADVRGVIERQLSGQLRETNVDEAD